MVKMLVKLMLQLSIVEIRPWKEWIQTLDPAFNVPTVQTVKASLYTIAKDIEYKITLQLKAIDYVNVSVDGWSDVTNRSFNGYVVQGITSNWDLLTIPFAFEPVYDRIFKNSF
jgi:hypothetical protein